VAGITEYSKYSQMSTNNAERKKLNMNVHKNKWGETKSICRTKKGVHEMESLDQMQV
jgi:hypothetical protein